MLSFKDRWFLTDPANYCKIIIEIDTDGKTIIVPLVFQLGQR
jgi:hypothetical protein